MGESTAGATERPAPVRDAGARVDAALAPSNARCSIELRALNYDNPGVDDAEFVELELRVLEGRPASWGDCGVHRLQLLNGTTPACEAYRTISLLGLPIRASEERVRICGVANPSENCLPSAALEVSLKNGWLQNGPDALRLVDGADQVIQSYSYGGAEHCGEVELPSETGKLTDDTGRVTDDVTLRCDADEYVLVPLDESDDGPEHASCRPAPTPDGEPQDAAPPFSEVGSSAAPLPEPREARAGRIYDGGIQRIEKPVFFDAGSKIRPPLRTAPEVRPPSLGCSVAGSSNAHLKWGASLLAPLALAGALWRRRAERTKRRRCCRPPR